VPHKAITMGIATIFEAKSLLLLASGSSKAKAISELVNGQVNENTPVTVLQRHPSVTVVVDQEAAVYLNHKTIRGD
jgi:glucosamine-6-phosphate deaminase